MEYGDSYLRNIQRTIQFARPTKCERKNPAGTPFGFQMARPFCEREFNIGEKDIFAAYKRLLNPAPKARISVSQFLDLGSRAGGFFSTDLIKCSEALENMSIKGDHEREIFLQYLHSQTHLTPHSVIVRYA